MSSSLSAQPASSDIRQPVPTTAQMAESRLRSNPYLALRNVSCLFEDGTLILRGAVSSYFMKQIAQEVVGQVDGVESLVNQIEVVGPPSCHFSVWE